jgi:hypothetical protein
MAKVLNGRFAKPSLALKSRNGLLSEADKVALDDFFGEIKLEENEGEL